VLAVHRPPRQVRERGDDEVDGELAHVAAHEADRAEEGERRRDRAHHDRPERLAAEAEDLLRERARRGGDDDQLENRPTEALQDVERGRQQGAAAPKRGAEHDHRRHPCIGADHPRHAEHRVPDDAREEDRRERTSQRERRDEERARDDHEQRDREIAPEEERVDEAEHPQALRDGLDSPIGRVGHALPSPVLTGSGSTGLISAPPVRSTPAATL